MSNCWIQVGWSIISRVRRLFFCSICVVSVFVHYSFPLVPICGGLLPKEMVCLICTIYLKIAFPQIARTQSFFSLYSSYLYYLTPEPEIFLNSYLHRSEKCSCIIFCMSLYVYMTLMEFGDVLRPLRSTLVSKK